MKTESHEIFFFVEEYERYYDRENYHQWKNTRNYMNKFCVSEDDSFDIIGIYTMRNPSPRDYPDLNDDQFLSQLQEQTLPERKKVFEHLAKASGFVHILYPGCCSTQNMKKRLYLS